MYDAGHRTRLDRPVDHSTDRTSGHHNAEVTLVQYGSYDCPSCQAANEIIADLIRDFDGKLCYVFRHHPVSDSKFSRSAAELSERSQSSEQFWSIHNDLMEKVNPLTIDDLERVSALLETEALDKNSNLISPLKAAAKVEQDITSANASGVLVTPTFFINGRRYDGPWDQHALKDALGKTLGHRARTAALDFLRWGPSAGLLLLIATVCALVLANSHLGETFLDIWDLPLAFSLGGLSFEMSLHHWINDWLLTFFFLVVGLEIKREFTVGHLANSRSAALPIAAAIGGMVVPVFLYSIIVPSGPWSAGWGIPMATDTAFAIAVIALLGTRVPLELRVFLTAAAVVDDIGAILVIAVFYSGEVRLEYLAAACAATGILALLNRSHIYLLSPYLGMGILLWLFVNASGLHGTLAGVLLAIFIPTRPPPNVPALVAQANTILHNDMKSDGDQRIRLGPSLPALIAINTVHDRMESPASRLLRHGGTQSNYLILPLFALANAGVLISFATLQTHQGLMLAIITGLVIGKPLGMVGAAAIAVKVGIAVKSNSYSWRHLIGATCLAGIGFTMSLFVAGQAFTADENYAASKIAVFVASLIAACVGCAFLWHGSTHSDD